MQLSDFIIVHGYCNCWTWELSHFDGLGACSRCGVRPTKIATAEGAYEALVAILGCEPEPFPDIPVASRIEELEGVRRETISG